MRAVGIIAEYDPLHNGHIWQLQEAKKRSGAQLAIVVMSTSFTQRGMPAILSIADRVSAALQAGADAVFALPTCWAIRDAEHFALGGVSILQALGCNYISFGAETADAVLMQKTAELIEDNSPSLQARIREKLNTGLPYPSALAQAAETLLPCSGALLETPNNTLGICYLRAIRKLGASIQPIIIPRTGSYHDISLPTDGFASASAVRAAFREGKPDAIQGVVPTSTYTALQHGPISVPDTLDAALLYRLRTMSAEDYTHLPGISEGIENRIQEAAFASTSREELLRTVKTKRYPYARLNRLCTHALLQLTEEQLSGMPLPELWLLGMRSSIHPLLRQAKEKGIRILHNIGDTDAQWAKTEQTANDLWCMSAGQSARSLQSQRMICFDDRREEIVR